MGSREVVRSIGRRKASTAEVFFRFKGPLIEDKGEDLVKGNKYHFPGSVEINGKPCIEYLQFNPVYLSYLRAPFCLRKGQLCTDKEDITDQRPLEVVSRIWCFRQDQTEERYILSDIKIKVRGGGLKGQVEAMQLGIARGLCKILSLPFLGSLDQAVMDGEERAILSKNNNATLRKSGFLTQDSRCKERKKYGLKKARKASQYSKR